MRLLRSMYLAAVMAACLFWVPAGAAGVGEPGSPEEPECPPEAPFCWLSPSQSIHLNPAGQAADAPGVALVDPGALQPLEISLPAWSPVDPVPLAAGPPDVEPLPVALRYQAPGEVTCGAQALGMALEGLDGGPVLLRPVGLSAGGGDDV